MSTSIIPTTAKSPFSLLPQDLEALIFEFIPLTDYSSLQLVSSRFNQTLREYPRLWARHLFYDFLKPSRDLDDFLEEEIHSEVSLINENQIRFNKMKTSKGLIQTHYASKQSLSDLLRQLLDAKSSQKLVKMITGVVTKPVYPCPLLKRDVHFFETKTLFQNFLTEVFFGVQSRCTPGDKKQALIRTVVDKLKQSSNVDDNAEKELLTISRASAEDNHSEADNSDEETDDPTTEFECPEPTEVLEYGSLNPNKFVESLWCIIQNLVQNRCDMILACLDAVATPQDLLNEYCRLWSEFTLTVMGMNWSLVPFTKFVNGLYKNCGESEHVPELSVWKLMLKSWKDTVYEPLSVRLFEAFSSLLSSVRIESTYSETCESFNPVKIPSHPFSDCPEKLTEVLSDKIGTLKAFYNTMGDLSYDETSVFYWNCLNTSEGTPKSRLNGRIIDETIEHYQENKPVWEKQPLELLHLFKEDQNLAEAVFDEELKLKIKESQSKYVKILLVEHLERLMKEQRRLFSPLLAYHDKLKDEISNQYEENQEVYLDIVQRGYGQTADDEEKTLFILPSSGFKEDLYLLKD